MAPIESFEHDSTAGRIAFGCGTIGDFGATFAALDADRALVVCGSNVGANRRLMDAASPTGAGIATTGDDLRLLTPPSMCAPRRNRLADQRRPHPLSCALHGYRGRCTVLPGPLHRLPFGTEDPPQELVLRPSEVSIERRCGDAISQSASLTNENRRSSSRE
jgi:hypothetical protein